MDRRNCTKRCEAMPECRECGQRKKPWGRDVPAATANSYCGYDCPGYTKEPKAGHLWPGEFKAAE